MGATWGVGPPLILFHTSFGPRSVHLIFLSLGKPVGKYWGNRKGFPNIRWGKVGTSVCVCGLHHMGKCIHVDAAGVRCTAEASYGVSPSYQRHYCSSHKPAGAQGRKLTKQTRMNHGCAESAMAMPVPQLWTGVNDAACGGSMVFGYGYGAVGAMPMPMPASVGAAAAAPATPSTSLCGLTPGAHMAFRRHSTHIPAHAHCLPPVRTAVPTECAPATRHR